MAQWTFYIETYGCRVNQYESQLIREAWQKSGGSECDQPEEAEFILINSCAITSRAERDARNAVFRLKRKAPKAALILCGCAAQFFAAFKPRKNANWAAPDYCISQAEKARLLADPRLLPASGETLPLWGIGQFKRARPVIKVQDGCSQYCSYCIVPQTRGKPQSRHPQDVLGECRSLLAKGYGELVISGVNLRQYGADNRDYGDFWDLLAWLDRELAPDFAQSARLRVSSIEPAQLGGKALETLTTCRMLCPHIHLSLQHASPTVLKAMRRHYKPEAILEFLLALGKHWPVMGLGADIIAGFPGETEKDLDLLISFIKDSGLNYAHVFPYSRRQGTIAADLPGQLSKNEKQARAEVIRGEVAAARQKFLEAQAKLPEMRVAADQDDVPGGYGKGINQYYAVCYYRAQNPAPRRLLTARPEKIYARGLLVELADKKSAYPDADKRD